VAILLMIIFNRLRLTRKQKSIIENQKNLVEEKQKEILDSIHYARRIQQAMLKDNTFSCPDLPPHFILHRPKDIVSGDFYWCRQKGDLLYLAVADCTGHGVPGALMSMLGITFLNEAVSGSVFPTPAELLDKTRLRIIVELSQTGKAGESKDGMDISLVRLNLKTNELLWAGANNPIWIVQNGDLLELKPDKQPVGYFPDPHPFTNHRIKLDNRDQFFLFSDGYADQFGGKNGKKFKYKQLKELVLNLLQKDMAEQKKSLADAFDEWKGILEQVDDVCVIGMKAVKAEKQLRVLHEDLFVSAN
jgi:serine phosphatase RsbU (regulator of sigma subunit)